MTPTTDFPVTALPKLALNPSPAQLRSAGSLIDWFYELARRRLL